MKTSMLDKLETVERRYEELNQLMASGTGQWQSLAQEQASLQPLVSKFRQYRQTAKEIEETEQLLKDGLEPEMAALVKQEIEALKKRGEDLMQDLTISLLPQDPSSSKNAIVEIRAGTGGEEAALFAADLFRMYTRYAQAKGWKTEMIDASQSDRGGFKEIIFEVSGKDAFGRLKHERGVHRVQRVPVTEAGGRIHTSTATVAVLSEAEEVEVNIRPDDLKVDIFHSGGPGGQNVNKVATAVRLTHLPTGMVVICQDDRSQLRNRNKAMMVLRARLFDMEQHKQQEEITRERRSQVGSAERAEKIRTYNFPQNRVTDHRIGLTLHNLPAILDGGLDELIDALAADERAKQLEELLGEPQRSASPS
jgi:peptide chain release factor 1